MKKLLFCIMAMLFSSLLLLGCGGSSEKASSPQSKQTELTSKICESAGIGDTLTDWVKDYGKPNREPNDLMKNFKDDALIAVIVNDRIYNITVQPTKEGKNPADENTLLPKDRKLVSDKNSGDKKISTSTKIYTSESLKKLIKGNPKGECTVIKNYDKKTGKFLGMVIDCTPSSADLQNAK